MKQMRAPQAPVAKRIFLTNISGDFFRRVNDPEGNVFYGIPDSRSVRGLYCYAVLNDGTISRAPQHPGISYSAIIDVIDQGVLGIKEIRWANVPIEF